MNNLKQLRAKNNLTQQQVADNCGIALRTYQRIEREERNGDIKTWKQLAKVLNTTLNDLLENNTR